MKEKGQKETESKGKHAIFHNGPRTLYSPLPFPGPFRGFQFHMGP